MHVINDKPNSLDKQKENPNRYAFIMMNLFCETNISICYIMFSLVWI